MDPQRLFGPIATRRLRIDQFDTFILNNIPYAEVPPQNVNWGAIEYDGPGALGIDGGKPVLQWHFGGVAYPISRAIRINYTYVRTWDGSNAVITTAIYLGFQDDLEHYIVPQATPFVARPTPTFQHRVGDLGSYGGFSTHSWASDAGILASEAQALVTRSVAYDAINRTMFESLLQDELGDIASLITAQPVPVDFDGPAQDYDSHRPFEYTFATLQNDPERYSQLLFWYFGGQVFRLTKAMRIPLDAALDPDLVRESVVLQALDGSGKQVSAHTRYGQLAKEAQGRQTFLTYKVTPPTATGGGTSASPPPTPVAGGNALFIGYSGPDPGGG